MIETIISFIIMFSIFELNLYMIKEHVVDLCIFFLIFNTIIIAHMFQFDYFDFYADVVFLMLICNIYMNSIEIFTEYKRRKKK